MKKLFAFFLAVFMIASMSVTVFADATIGAHDEFATITVGGDFQPTGAIYKTISVDIEWDDMTFAYIKTSSGEWDPGSHEYVGGVEGAWSEETRAITVTNHSDTEITATLSFETTAQVEGAFTSTGEMSSVLELDSAVGAEVAPSVSDEFGIVDGDPLAEDGSLGTITVTIEAPVGTITEGPMITAATLSGDANQIDDNTYQVECTYFIQYNTVGIALTGENIDMIVGQEHYVVGFMAPDGTVSGVEPLGEFTYNETENTLTGEMDIRFIDGTLTLVYSADAGETWIKLPVRVSYYMKINSIDISVNANSSGYSKATWDEATQTYTIRYNAFTNNTELSFIAYAAGIQYLTGTISVNLRKSDGTSVESVGLWRGDLSGSSLCETVRDPNVVEGETLSIWYHYNGEWHDTGKKVVYEVYYSISDKY